MGKNKASLNQVKKYKELFIIIEEVNGHS